MKHIIFDLDETLVDTSELKTYYKTGEGRIHATRNINNLPTKIYDEKLPEIMKELQESNKVSVVTNSPCDYAVAVLRKHGFPSGTIVYGSAQKPLSGNIEQIVKDSGIPYNQTIIVGDNTRDIVAAHGAKVPSIGVTWGSSSAEELRVAEPTRLAETTEELEELIEKFLEGNIGYEKRKEPQNYEFLCA